MVQLKERRAVAPEGTALSEEQGQRATFFILAVVLHRIEDSAFQAQGRGYRHLPHDDVIGRRFGQQQHAPVLPGEIVQVAARHGAVRGEGIVHLPGWAVVGPAWEGRVVRVADQVEGQGLKERLALHQEDDTSCAGSVSELLR